MIHTFWIGIIGSLILLSGAAWPENRKTMTPTKSTKNWLFFVGGFIMLLYAYLNFLTGGPVFFLILEILVVLASILMMLGTPDKFDLVTVSICSIALIAWSLFLFEGYTTIIFIIGLAGVGLGYAFESGTARRNIALTAGSALIALFSYLEASWIFFFLNLFFAIFSGYYIFRIKK